VGCPIAFAKRASCSCSVVYAIFFIFIPVRCSQNYKQYFKQANFFMKKKIYIEAKRKRRSNSKVYNTQKRI
ncbi:MAG: hypothetical protein PUB61_09585, partial [Bacteroidales bacterium]|nr:hypothetical protein [Bacteroidales bacterium]